MFQHFGKALTEKTIYILIAFFHFINSSSAFHPGGCRNVCKHVSLRKNHRRSRAVKGPQRPQTRLPPALESLLCGASLQGSCPPRWGALPPASLHPERSQHFKCLERSYLEQEVDALALSPGQGLHFGATHVMNGLPFRRREGHTCEDGAGSSEWSPHPSERTFPPASPAWLLKAKQPLV